MEYISGAVTFITFLEVSFWYSSSGTLLVTPVTQSESRNCSYWKKSHTKHLTP